MNEKRRIFERGWFTVLMLFLFFPIGSFLLWKYHRKHKILNVILTIFFGYPFLCIVLAIGIFSFSVYKDELAQKNIELANSVSSTQENTENIQTTDTTENESETTIETTLTPTSEQATETKATENSQVTNTTERETTTIETTLTLTTEQTTQTEPETQETTQSMEVHATEKTTKTQYENETNVFKKFDHFTDELLKIGARNTDSKTTYLQLNQPFLKDNYFSLVVDTVSEYIFFGSIDSNGRPHGEGVILKKQYLYDTVFTKYLPYYSGDFENGMFHGYGLLYTYDNGLLHIEYDGYFKKGKKDGQGNEISYSLDSVGFSGDVYRELSKDYVVTLSGAWNEEFENRLSSYVYGIEKYWISENSISADMPVTPRDLSLILYVGNFKNGEKSGKGKIFLYEKLLYDGEFKNNLVHGNGMEYFANGTIHYEGDFSKGQWHGKGNLYYSNGSKKYKGQFSKGQYNGEGTLYNEDETVKFKGTWKKGSPK